MRDRLGGSTVNVFKKTFKQLQRWWRAWISAFNRGRDQFKQRQALDRQIGQMTLLRDRNLGALAHAFIHSRHVHSPASTYTNLIQEIHRVESDRKSLVREPTSLTQLIIPEDYSAHESHSADFQLLDHAEQQEKYRQRLRGLYLDLGGMLHADQLGRSFRSEWEAVETVQQKLRELRDKRERIQDTLLTSQNVLPLLKILVAISLVLVTCWVLV